jgi:hypothetical protein
VVLLDIVRTNAWTRPLTFAATGTEHAMEWLEPYGRLDGLYYRVTAVRHPPPDVARLRTALLENARYRSYADTSVVLDDVARQMGWLAYQGITALLHAETTTGDGARCGAERNEFYALIPPRRIWINKAMGDPAQDACN